jgi:hypothetical protein
MTVSELKHHNGEHPEPRPGRPLRAVPDQPAPLGRPVRPSAGTSRKLRRYRRNSLTTGRVNVILAVAVVAALLAGLAVVALPWPASPLVAVTVVVAGILVVLADARHEDNVGS